MPILQSDVFVRRCRAAILGAAIAAVAVGFSLPMSALAQERPAMATVVANLTHASSAEGGLFEVYYASDPAAKNPSEIYAAIPRSLLGTDLLLATTVNSGPSAGFQWSDYLVRFQQLGDNLVLMVPDLRYKENTAGPVGDSVKRTYTPTILTTLPIRGEGPGGTILVDLSPLTISGGEAPGLRGPANPQLSRHPKVKVFPDNVLIDSELVAGRAGASVGMSYSFRRLPNLTNPQTRYWPRNADERVGFFLTASQDWGKAHDARDTVDRYVNRWRVEKLDPSLEMSPPKDPIVFYVEKTVPVQWRRYVQEGIVEWNKAYEKIGIVGAIEVRQQTDTAYADIDPEDARYNFLRWIVTGQAFAMGPSRVDPRTGQILDADIIFDDSMLRYFEADLNLLGPKTLALEMGPDTLEFWREHPGFRPMGMTDADVDQALLEVRAAASPYTSAGSNFGVDQDPQAALHTQNLIAQLAGEAGVPMRKASRTASHIGLCDYADGARRQLATANLMHAAAAAGWMAVAQDAEDGHDHEETPATQPAAEGEPAAEGDEVAKKVVRQKLPERYLGIVLKEVVAHEVGHTLGLRHNFKASAWLSMDEIVEARAAGDKPLVASVMDYNPLLLFAGDNPAEIQTFMTPVIGPYDEWAIEYGYTILPRNAEAAGLAEIAGKSGQKELAYATDEDTTGLASPDPYVNRYDMSDDQVTWAKTRVELADALIASLQDWAVEDGEPNEYLRSAFLNLFGEKVSATLYVSRVVGGQSFSRSRFSDTIVDGDQPGLTPMDPVKQREALGYLAGTVFSDDFYKMDAELLNKIVPSRMPGVSGWPGSQIDFPVHNTILNAQNRALSPLCDPTILQRIYDAQLKSTAEDKFTAAELVSTVSNAIWGDLAVEGEFTDATPMLSSIRRNLQTQHLNYLIAMVDSRPGALMSSDLQNLVRYQLRSISNSMGEALGNEGKLDMASAAHLFESKSRIDRVLEAPYVNVPAGGGQTIIMMGQEAQQ